MSNQPGFRVCTTWARADTNLLEGFSSLPASNVADVMNRLGVVGNGIHAMWSDAACVGSALTVWTRSGDNLMLHKAINMAQPGDVIVVNGQGDTGRALFGELMARSAAALKVAGLVFDGAVRDIDALADVRLPVFARASTPAGPFKNGPGEIGYPVACGGVVCMSGDIVLADADGVVVVPQADAPRVLENARAKADSETKRRREIANGTPYRAGIDEELVQKGVLEI